MILKFFLQILIATATVAWGVNFPAHLVVIKGTEYYDGKQKRYVDMPITDVLQMMGRAGRPQFDDHGVNHFDDHGVDHFDDQGCDHFHGNRCDHLDEETV